MKQFKYEENEKLNIELTPAQFLTLRNALGQAMSFAEIRILPEKKVYVSTATGAIVKKPAKGQVENGQVILTTDPESTFNPENLQVQYDANKVTIDMLNATLLVESIFKSHVDQGLAKEVEVNG